MRAFASLRLRSWSCALMLASACTGGQSGTESEGGKFDDPWTTLEATDCGCALANTGSAVRATLDSQDACGLRATVRELLGRGAEAEGPKLEVGDELGGAPLLPCAEGLSLSAGDELLIIHVPGPEATIACPERLGCEAGCPLPALGPDGGIDAASIDTYDVCAQRCAIDTADACAAHTGYAQLHGQLLVVPWAQTLQVSSAEDSKLSLPRAQLATLLDPLACGKALYPESAASAEVEGDLPSAALDVVPSDADAGAEPAPRCGTP